MSTSADCRRSFLAITLYLACAAGAAAQVPAAWRVSRDPEEWHRQLAREEALGSLDQRFPDGWSKLWERWGLVIHPKENLDIDAADVLISELYLDHGHPRLNEANQNVIIGFIYRISGKWPEEQLPAAARQRLAAGLLEFLEAGGGRNSPSGQAQLAVALDRLSPSEPEIQTLVEDLLNDAARWTTFNESHPIVQQAVYDVAAKYWGEAYWFQAYERFHASALPEKRPLRYEKALEALVGVLSQEARDERTFLRDMGKAANAVLRGCGEPAFDDDLTSRLLILYRGLLRRRPRVAEKAAEYIDGQLERLARGSDRLRREVHWDLWGQAVAALGLRRMGEGLEKYARRLQRSAAAGKLDGPRSKAAGYLEFLGH